LLDDDSNNFQTSLNSIEQQEQEQQQEQQQQQQQSTAPFPTSPNSTISNSIHSPLEETRSISKSLINKKKRGRKSKTDKDHELLSDDGKFYHFVK
jgi:hypothetical protein